MISIVIVESMKMEIPVVAPQDGTVASIDVADRCLLLKMEIPLAIIKLQFGRYYRCLYVTDTLSNLLHQTAFFNLTWGNYLMIVVACVFLYLAIAKGFEPLLLVPIAFGMLLVNIYPDIMANPEDMSNGVGGLLHYFYMLDEWSILPSLIFMGVGAMTDFGPLIANPKSFITWCSCTVWYLCCLLRLQSSLASTERQQQLFPLSVVQMALHLFSLQVSWDSQLIDGTYRCGGIFLYVPGAYHPASDHEAAYNRKRAKDQDGTASSCIQAGEDPLPNHRSPS